MPESSPKVPRVSLSGISTQLATSSTTLNATSGGQDSPRGSKTPTKLTPRRSKDKDKDDHTGSGNSLIDKFPPLALISPRKKHGKKRSSSISNNNHSPTIQSPLTDAITNNPSADESYSSSSTSTTTTTTTSISTTTSSEIITKIEELDSSKLSSSITASISDSFLFESESTSVFGGSDSQTKVAEDTTSDVQSLESDQKHSGTPPSFETNELPVINIPVNSNNSSPKKSLFSIFRRNKPASTNNTPILIPEKSPAGGAPKSAHLSSANSGDQKKNTQSQRQLSNSLDSTSTLRVSQTMPNSAMSSPSPNIMPFSPLVMSSGTIPSSPLRTSILQQKPRGSGALQNSLGVGSATKKGHQHESNLSFSNSNTTSTSSTSSSSTTSLRSPAVSTTSTAPLSMHTSSPSTVATDTTWLMMASNWDDWSDASNRALLTKYVYQGIPDRFRPTMWYNMSNMIQQLSYIPSCTELAMKYKQEQLQPLTPISTPSMRGQLMSSSSSLAMSPPPLDTANGNATSSRTSPITLSSSWPHAQHQHQHKHKCFYNSILKYPSEHEEQIDVDIQRSFIDIPDQQRDIYADSLRRVLKAISLYDSEMGYCQGISFIGCILITRVPEEETFHILLRLLEGVMRDFYIIGMRGLKLRLFQLSRLMRELFPKLHKHLESIELDYTIFASPWFMTAFAYHLSEECAVRILDVILLQGIEAFFSVGLAIFQTIEGDLLECEDSSQAMEFFRCNAKQRIEINALMDTAARIHISASQLANFAAQFEQENPKPVIPSEFNPEAAAPEKVRNPNWVVKKYKMKEYTSNLEEDLAVMKRELYSSMLRNDEERAELSKHLQDLAEHESSLLQERAILEVNNQQLSKENQKLREQLQKASSCNEYLAKEMHQLRAKVDKEVWTKNPKQEIKWV
ncbi:hypothetical protein SAMD00019534_096850 [Acytostelium subglobosum LB1]|uniref:hypothetical protein n=1 Tax=Acytostelium subglobosum LB1 TaxID=1410327 RepID=UPI000644FF45|nr:hypothetical protein SAMD00019534_096850 [Acytostelium subglobosum LB1]GAM26510.1 hypothetical protein SAMD00019534_096850 [Acytostelium subglobosum LB1]|eukprot:XP_012750606.1 hypothetical protein SAMD00019534_096850 [Acytostelium subglobosum LB1]